jgi:NitT/TauT family transport system substrate-binding protein
MPGPGTTGHYLLATLLARAHLEPSDVALASFGGTALVSRLAGGQLAAAVVDEPWAELAVETGAGRILVDFRRPEETARRLGGPFHEVVSVARADEARLAELEPALTAYVRALVRVQAWLVATPAGEVAERLPASLVGNRARFVARLGAARAAYAPDGHATDAGLRTTLQVLRAGSPWPVGLKVSPETLGEPAFVTAARTALGPAPPPP